MMYFNTKKEFIDYLQQNKNNILITEDGGIFCRVAQQTIGCVRVFNKESLQIIFYDYTQDSREVAVPTEILQNDSDYYGWHAIPYENIISFIIEGKQKGRLFFGANGFLEKRFVKESEKKSEYIYGQLLSEGDLILIKFYDELKLPRAKKMDICDVIRLITPVKA